MSRDRISLAGSFGFLLGFQRDFNRLGPTLVHLGAIEQPIRGHVGGFIIFEDVLRLFELAVLSKKVMVKAAPDGTPAWVTDYKVLGDLLNRVPGAKWDLLTQVLQVTYGRKTGEAVNE